MTEGVIIAIITGLFAVLGQYLITRRARQEDEVKRAVLDERTANRLAAIEHKLDVHNGYAEMIGEVQQDIAAIKADIKNLKERR